MSSPVGYPQRNAYPMFSSTSQGDVPVGKNGTNLTPVMVSTPSSGGIEVSSGDLKLGVFISPRLSLVGPGLAGSLVAGATASQSGSVVTVSATAHGLPSAAQYTGFSFYYPGSASIPAGWYPGFTYVDANTFRFSAPSATVASESVSGGAAFTSMFTVGQATIPAGLLNTGSSVRWAYQRGGNPATDKHVRAYFGGAQVGVADTFNTTPFAERGITMRVLNSTWGCCPNLDNSNASGQQFTAINTAVDNVVALTMQLTAPQLFGVVFGHEIYWR